MRLVTAVVSLALLSGCQSMSEPKTPTLSAASSQRDGSTPELAVDLSSAHTEIEGIQAEKSWIDQHYPGSTVESQAFVLQGAVETDDLAVGIDWSPLLSQIFDDTYATVERQVVGELILSVTDTNAQPADMLLMSKV